MPNLILYMRYRFWMSAYGIGKAIADAGNAVFEFCSNRWGNVLWQVESKGLTW